MSRKILILVLLIAVKILLQYLAINPIYELHRDEFLHIDLGKHLELGYSSVPPVTSWISWLILKLGGSVFMVKFFPLLFGILTMIVVWKATEELGGGLFAMVLSSVCIIFSALLRLNTLFQPNSLEYLMWTVVFFGLIKYFKTEDKNWIWFTSVALALGFLNKYNIAFAVLGLLPAILLSGHRKLLINKQFFLSLLLAFVIVLPNLVWQVSNDFPVFQHLKKLSETQLVNVARLDFLKEQLLFFFGSIYVLIGAFVSFYLYPPFRKYRVFFWSTIFTLAILTFFKAKSYYSIGLYPILFAFGSVYLEKITENGWMKLLRPVTIILPILFIAYLFQFFLPVLSPADIVNKQEKFERLGLLRWEDGRNHAIPQDFADMLGWKELAGLVDQALNQVEDKSNTLIHCDNYGQAGSINYYGRDLYTDAVSLNADYINWYPLNSMRIENVILVKGGSVNEIDLSRERLLFDSVILIGEVKEEYARESGTKVFLLKGAKQSINEIFRKEINK